MLNMEDEKCIKCGKKGIKYDIINFVLTLSDGSRKCMNECRLCFIHNKLKRYAELNNYEFTLFMDLEMKRPTGKQLSLICSHINVDVANIIIDYYEAAMIHRVIYGINQDSLAELEKLMTRSSACAFKWFENKLTYTEFKSLVIRHPKKYKMNFRPPIATLELLLCVLTDEYRTIHYFERRQY
jgi:hypothetical protein